MDYRDAPIQDPISKDVKISSPLWVLWFKGLVKHLTDTFVPYSGANANVNLNGKNLNNVNCVQLGIAPVTVPTTEGTLSWSTQDRTLNIQSEIADSVLQVGQENWVRVVNKTGIQIDDGQAVYISGAQGNRPKVSLAKADSESTSYTIGVATANIANNAEGYATVFGLVRGFNTSGFTAGDALYLSAVTAGALTNVRPSAPNHGVFVGYALNSTPNGMIFVNPDTGSELSEQHDVKITSVASGDIIEYDSALGYWKNVPLFADNLDPTGWVDQENITVTYDSIARTITLTHPSGILAYYWRGQKKTLTSPWVSTAHTNTTGVRYFLSSSDGTNFTWATTIWNFYDVMVSVVTFEAAYKFALREVHGCNTPWSVHETDHLSRGTFKESGGVLGGYTLASTTPAFRRPTVDACSIHDEDVHSVLASLASGTYTQMYLTSTGVITFTTAATDIVPVLVNNPYYNSFTTPNWTQTLMANNSYMSVWLIGIPTSADATSQAYRFCWMQGQSDGTLASQQALTPTSLNLGNLTTAFAEFVFLAQVIVRYTGGNWHLESVTALTGTRTSVTGIAGTFLSAVTSNTTLTGLGTPASPLGVVQATTNPVMDGIVAIGTSVESAKADHVHPTDTSREPANVNIQAHIASVANPHNTTYAQVGADPAGTTATHAALTTTHGTTGAIVGTTNTQTLTNKTLSNPILDALTLTTSAGNTGAAALPATPAGFATFSLNGTNYKIPYYPV